MSTHIMSVVFIYVVLIQAGLPADAFANEAEALRIVSHHKGIFTSPPKIVPTIRSVDGPIMGNGDVGVVMAGNPESQLFYIGKNDFWSHSRKVIMTVGGVRIRIPALQGAGYCQEQKLLEAEVNGRFTADTLTMETSSWTAAGENLLVTELTFRDGRSAPVEVANWSGPLSQPKQLQENSNINGMQVGGNAASSRIDESILLTTRSANPNQSEVEGRWASIATRVIGAPVTISKHAIQFELAGGNRVYVVSAILSDLDAKEHQSAAVTRIAKLNISQLQSIKRRHRQWWEKFWSQSFIQIPDKLIESVWYGSHYAMACCSREGEVAPGLWGNFITVDGPGWRGDFHLNYNYEAPFWGLYSSNHTEQTGCYDQPLLDYMPKAKAGANKLLNNKGLYCPVGIAPWGMDTDYCMWGQKSNASLTTANMFLRFYHTYDLEYARTVYPYIVEVATFWEDYLKFENGRYIVYEDSLLEQGPCLGPWKNLDMNNHLSLGLIRMVFKGVLDMSRELGKDADRREKWQHIRDHISEFPTFKDKGKTFFAGAEKGRWSGKNDWGWVGPMGSIWPARVIGLNSDPELLQVARNTIESVGRNNWINHNNNIVTIFPSAVRVGHDPKDVLEKLRESINKRIYPNFFIAQLGGGIEVFSAVPSTVNEMLVQSHEKELFLFPVWPKDKPARFGNLRTPGAFLVSGGFDNGQVQYVFIESEKGRDCRIRNPWSDRAAIIYRDGKKAETLTGNRLALRTDVGEKISLCPKGISLKQIRHQEATLKMKMMGTDK